MRGHQSHDTWLVKVEGVVPLCRWPQHPSLCTSHPLTIAANISLGGPAWQAGVAPPVITYLMAMNHEPVVNSGEVRREGK